MMIMNMGGWEWALIFLIILLLFGGKKLPGLARSIGSGISEFKKGLSGQGNYEDDDEEPEEDRQIDSKKSTGSKASSRSKSRKS